MLSRSMSFAATGFALLLSAQAYAQGYTSKDDGGNAQIPGCFSTFTPGTNCTSAPTLTGEGAILSATEYYETLSPHILSTTPPPPFPTEYYGPGVCGSGNSSWKIDCTAYCPAIGYASGALATATPSCGIAPQPYCSCSGPGAAIVDHVNLTPAATSNPVGTCVQVDVQLVDAANTVVPAPAAYTVYLVAGNATGKLYYSNATCTTTLVGNRVAFAAGDVGKTVYYKNSAVGSVNIQAMFPGLVPQLVPISFF